MMRPATVCVLFSLLFLAVAGHLVLDGSAQAQPPVTGKDAGGADAPAPDHGAASPKAPFTPNSPSNAIGAVVLLAFVAVLILAGRSPENPHIRKLGPSFFFWLGILYLATLLVIAVAYITNCYGFEQFLDDPVAGIMPIAVPWFGALGAVLTSLQGVYDYNDRWDPKYNYWHMGRPLFGAVVGIVAFFLLTVTVSASGATPTAKGRVFYYVVAFLVGYREETFRELLKRAVDVVFTPAAVGAFAGTLTVTATNLSTPKTIQLSVIDA
jgi:hypothetical protein